MTTAVQHRRGTTAEHSTFTGLEGEVTIDTTKDTAVIHDGSLAGGYPLAKETLANVNPSTLSAITGAATASDDLFLMYDTSALAMKKISRAELNNAITIEALDTVDINGGTIDGTAIGGTTPAAGSFTTLTTSGTVTHSGGTANGVAYLNGSKVLTSGSALTFDGAQLGVNGITVGRGAGAVSTNTAVGASALAANTTGSQNVAVGQGALQAGTTATYTTAVGRGALASNTTGNSNTAVGQQALNTNVDGSNNTAFGTQALLLNVSGAYNTAIGLQALRANTVSANTAVGYLAGYSNTTGQVDAFGYRALYSNTTGGYQAAFGYQALEANTTGGANSAFGYQNLRSNTTGINNTAIGSQSMIYSTTASQNTGVGQYALVALTTGADNSSVGKSSMYANTTGSYNTALGSHSLYSNTTASNNTAVGYQAGYSNQTAAGRTTLGAYSGYLSTAGGYSTFVGYAAGYNSTGSGNTFVGTSASGAGAGEVVTSGSKNTILGGYNGNQGGLDIRTSDGYIVLSDGDGNPRGYHNGTVWTLGGGRTVVGAAFVGDNVTTGNNVGISFGGNALIPCNGAGTSTDNTLNLGSGSNRYATVYAGTGTINTSDANAKQDIEDLSDAERRVAVRIKGLIKKFRFKDSVEQKGAAARIHVGVIAQDVQAAFVAEGLISDRYGLFCSDTWYEVNGQGLDENKRAYTADTPGAVEKTRLGIRYDELLAFVIAAI